MNIIDPGSKRKNLFLQCNLQKLCQNNQGEAKFFLLRDFAPEALPFTMPQWAFVAFLGEVIKMLVSISGLLWCFGWPWQNEEEIWVEEFNSFLLKPWRGVNGPGTNSPICWLYYVDFFRAFRKWIGKTGIRHKAAKGHYQCAEKLYNVSGSHFLSFRIGL